MEKLTKITYKDIVEDVDKIIKESNIDDDSMKSLYDVLAREEGDTLEGDELQTKILKKYPFKEVDEYEEDSYQTYVFRLDDIYVEVYYYYNSYNGRDYSDGGILEVQPVQIIKTVYQSVK